MERTNYMQTIMIETYSGVGPEAVLRGFDGAWERLIAKRLLEDQKQDISEAVVILESTGNDPMKAAKMILNSKI